MLEEKLDDRRMVLLNREADWFEVLILAFDEGRVTRNESADRVQIAHD